MIRYFEAEGLDILLAAPTGRAAKRMTEATGYEARTIHRLLELNGAMLEEENRYGKNAVSYTHLYRMPLLIRKSESVWMPILAASSSALLKPMPSMSSARR